MSKVVKPEANAEPAAVATLPSIPEVPLLQKYCRSGRLSKNWEIRTGVLLANCTTHPEGITGSKSRNKAMSQGGS